jgi:hypothetical protein
MLFDVVGFLVPANGLQPACVWLSADLRLSTELLRQLLLLVVFVVRRIVLWIVRLRSRWLWCGRLRRRWLWGGRLWSVLPNRTWIRHGHDGFQSARSCRHPLGAPARGREQRGS